VSIVLHVIILQHENTLILSITSDEKLKQILANLLCTMNNWRVMLWPICSGLLNVVKL